MKYDTENERRPSILVVDDDPAMVRVLSRIVAPLGDVRFALSGDDMLEAARASPPDLILLDAEMPGLGGFDACAQLKQDEAIADVPVIFVTSHSDESTEQRGLDVGGADFISKPVRPPILLARARTQLRLKQAVDRLKRTASIDPLTGVANRRAFAEAVRREWRRAGREGTALSLLMIDVDHFKRFNDHYGHAAGDLCLAQVARALGSSVSRPSDLLARFGGEEFVVLLPGTSGTGMRVVADRLVAAVRTLAIPHAQAPAGYVSVSVGAAACDVVASTGATLYGALDDSLPGPAQALLEAADTALYQAKAAGRDRVAISAIDSAS